MYSLKDHLRKPINESQNLHLEHIEDVILNDGLAGAHIALNFLENIRDQLTGHSSKSIDVTTKWDGSPAIVCGTNPENGQFFVGTKSVFNKGKPKICYSEEDARKVYAGQPDLVEKLAYAHRYLKGLGIDGVLQGDLMFVDKDVKTQMIDGEQYVTFKPNTIMYAVPADSELADRIGQAKLGIVFHTSYTGDTLKSMKPSYLVNLEELNYDKDVWVDDASYRDETGTVTLTQDEVENVTRHLDAANEALSKLDPIRFEELLTSNKLVGLLKMYTNHRIRSGKQYDNSYMGGLADYVNRNVDDEQVTDATKEKKRAAYNAQLQKLEPVLSEIVTFQHHINEAKLLLLKKLQKLGSVGTFVPTEDGFEATDQEGFVAIDHLTNKAIKLVDRLNFSRKNFERFRK